MNLPISLPAESNILVAGAGGGFDIVCALPVILSLKSLGHNVELANFSFTHLTKLTDVLKPMENLYGVTAKSRLMTSDYCPEAQLAKWWKRKFDEEKIVWCYSGIGVKPLAEIFSNLKERLNLDAILVLDGGVDGLFYGNEYNTGTPSMDAVSVIAGSLVEDCKRFYGFTAFGTEGSNQEVRHCDALLRISELIQRNALLGVCTPRPGGAIASDFINCLDYIHSTMEPNKHSIMAGSIKCALEGSFGMQAFNAKTKSGPVWVSALTMLYWFFDLDTVAAVKPIYRNVLESSSVMEVADAFEVVRERQGAMERSDIPI